MSNSGCTKKGPVVKSVEYRCTQQSVTVYRIDKRYRFNGEQTDGTKCDFWTGWLEYTICASGQGCSNGKCVS